MTAPKHVEQAYAHSTKQAVARPPLTLRAALLKWYDIAQPDTPISSDIYELARDYTSRLIDAELSEFDGDYGFVILHRCRADFYFLLLSVWRGSNELWEAVHFKDLSSSGFQPFDPAYPFIGLARPTYCVWELGVVGHEAQAWTRFLSSDRTTDDLATWSGSVFDGPV